MYPDFTHTLLADVWGVILSEAKNLGWWGMLLPRCFVVLLASGLLSMT
jgi:hypothetical protein